MVAVQGFMDREDEEGEKEDQEKERMCVPLYGSGRGMRGGAKSEREKAKCLRGRQKTRGKRRERVV